MMKFTGLILICAASSLALLLPALGVVKFPMVDSRQASAGLVDPSMPQGLPVAATGLPVHANAGLPNAELGQPAAAGPLSAGPGPSSTGQGAFSLVGPPWTKQKVGISAWLLLGPVLLLGLGLWTFGPNRGGSGR
ncbi:MAG: hypothetical protein ACK553_10215 [Planctomycetota bacterium]|jgi:hypothetical protein